MRLRILAPVVVLVMLLSVAVLVPVLQSISRDRAHDLDVRRSATLDRFGRLATASLERDVYSPMTSYRDRHRSLYDEPLIAFDGSGTVVVPARDVDPAAPHVAEPVAKARRNQPVPAPDALYPWSDPSYVLAAPVLRSSDLSGGVVAMEVDASGAIADVRRLWAIAITIAVAVVALFTTLALWFSRWVVRPVLRLDQASHELAHGRRPDRIGKSGPPELRRLATSFDEMAALVTATIEAQGRLAQDFSHRLRNPLAAVRLRIDALQARPDPDPQTLALVQADLDRLEAMVGDMLELAAAEHRRDARSVGALAPDGGEPITESTDLFVAEVVARWAEPAAARGVTVRSAGAIDHLQLACSPIDCHDALDELIENAVRHAGAGSEVEISLEDGADLGVVTVADDGPGLTEAEMGAATERFWRGPQPEDDVPSTGLGLSIVENLARAYGGSVRLERSARGGLAVSIELPVVPS